MKTRTINPVFGEKHKAYIQRAMRCTISVAEGAVRAGKTIDNIAAFAALIEKGTPDRIHLATGSQLLRCILLCLLHCYRLQDCVRYSLLFCWMRYRLIA